MVRHIALEPPRNQAEAANYMTAPEEPESGSDGEPESTGKSEKAKGDGSSWLDVVAFQSRALEKRGR